MASYFQDRGVAAVSLHSGTNGITKGEEINSLTSEKLEVIFTVDLFNEGVDIPSVNTLLFVRPTESLTAMVGIAKRGESRSFFVAYFCLVKATLNDLIFDSSSSDDNSFEKFFISL